MTTTRLTFPLYGLGLEWHQPSQRPYPGAPGFVLTHCPACDGRRERVQLDTEKPAACQVWRLGCRERSDYSERRAVQGTGTDQQP